jgi:hypothetical protein
VSQDGFGIRTLGIDQETGDPVEILTLAPTLARAPEFVTAVGERVARVARVRHAMYARSRAIDRTAQAVTLISDHVPGWRLDRVLDVIEQQQWKLDINAIIVMLRQLIPAVALFSRHQRDATIGTIGPERLILTPQGRLVVAEYVLAPGLEKMQFSRERLWREFRVAVPHTTSVSRIPPSADVVGIGVVAFSLLLGRRLKNDEYLVALGDLSDSLMEWHDGVERRLSRSLSNWVAHALQFEISSSFQTVQEAQVAFEEMLAKERSYVTTAAELDRFITRFEKVAGAPRMPLRDEPPLTVQPEPLAVTKTIGAAVRDSGRHTAAAAVALAPPAASPARPVPPATPAPPVPPAPPAPPDTAFSQFALPKSDNVISLQAPAANASGASDALSAPIAVDAQRAPWTRFALPMLGALVVIQALVIAWLMMGDPATALTDGELRIESRPAAARVTINGEERGVTPFQATISPGSHVVEIRVGRSEPRVIPIVIREGVQTGLYVELQSVATVGGLEVRSEPARARVTIGGQFRGETPLVLNDLPPGEVEVVVQAGSRQVRQSVRIEPGITSQLVVPLGR